MPRKLLDNECRYDRLVPRRIAHGQFRFFAYIIMPTEAYCQADHGINAVGFRKSTKYCDSFRFLKLFCVHFSWEGTFSSRIDTNLTVTALKMAVNRQKPQDNLIFHSDRGVQYASAGYREALAEYNITQSMSRKGEPYDNAVAENFFSCLKCELVHHKHYRTRSEAQADIFAYIEAYYNSVRPQSALNWLSPVEYERLLSVYAAKVA